MHVYYFARESHYYSIIIDKTQLADLKASEKKEFKKGPAGASTYMLSKEFCYEVLSLNISRFNDELAAYYQASPEPQADKIPQEMKKYLY
jgi:hypothetical protein